MSTKTESTIADLYKVEGKAELVHGEIVPMSPTGGQPNYAASEIFVSLREYARRTKTGHAVNDNAAFTVDLPHRKSFSPDADLLSEEVVRVYRASEPERPKMYRRGQMAEAEPAVPGWRMPVDDLFADAG